MTRLNLACGAYPLEGFENLDLLLNGWRFEDGLGQYGDGSIEAITESHGLMYVPLAWWPTVFAEFRRVLEPGGVLRVTEDWTDNPDSERFGGHHDAVTLTGPEVVCAYTVTAKFRSSLQVAPDRTLFRDKSLIQSHHGEPPKVFYVEAVR